MKRTLTALVASLALLTFALPVGAKTQFQEVIPLPDGIFPEGIVSGVGTEFFVGSLANGAIYRGDYRTGEGEFINNPADFVTPRIAVGLSHDRRTDLLWVAGGPSGEAYVYDAGSGETVATYSLGAPGASFVNDVIVTRDAAYFTDSFQPVFYAAAVDAGGAPTGDFETIPLSGDFQSVAGAFNSNGIEATANGSSLILVNSELGVLYELDPVTGETNTIDLGAAAVPSGDGLLLVGRTLYVVQNFFNQIAVVELSPDLESGEVVDIITDSDFMVPTTAALFGSSVYAVNARFDVPPGPDVEYDVVKVDR